MIYITITDAAYKVLRRMETGSHRHVEPAPGGG